METEDKASVIPKLRVESRRKYLEKRKGDKITELEADIFDDEYLFDEQQLTERERKDREYKKNILSLAKEHDKARELELVQRYHMPDDKREKAMPDRYVEIDDREKQPHSEQKVWEDARMATAQWNFGARDAKQRLQEKGKVHDYDLLLDDTIDFIQTNQLAGTKGIEGKVTHLKPSE
jgi:pre-mRNA-splicing factor ATP-dependent RNA helicase DHX16